MLDVLVVSLTLATQQYTAILLLPGLLSNSIPML